jgi:hypothetical protein
MILVIGIWWWWCLLNKINNNDDNDNNNNQNGHLQAPLLSNYDKHTYYPTCATEIVEGKEPCSETHENGNKNDNNKINNNDNNYDND